MTVNSLSTATSRLPTDKATHSIIATIQLYAKIKLETNTNTAATDQLLNVKDFVNEHDSRILHCV